jgi:ABC-type multidrug transport system fused ATPase/permease subunit
MVSTERIIEYTKPSDSWPEFGKIEVKDLSVMYPGSSKLVLNNISFMIPAGSKVYVLI